MKRKEYMIEAAPPPPFGHVRPKRVMEKPEIPDEVWGPMTMTAADRALAAKIGKGNFCAMRQVQRLMKSNRGAEPPSRCAACSDPAPSMHGGRHH